MATVVEQFVALLGWDVPPAEQKKLKQFDKSMGKIIDGFGKMAVAAGAALAGIVALTAHTNKQTTIQNNLAAAVGLSAEKLDALAAVTENIGFDFEKTVDLVEELNNKFGEFELTGMTSVKESLHLLGLEFKDLKDLSPEDQFIRIMDAAKDLDNQQVAVSAVDMLMGGDANKILGHLKNYDGSLSDIMERYQELNFLTDEGRDGAKDFTMVLGELTFSVGSLWKEFSGLLGKALGPYIDLASTWIRQNRKLIKQKLREWVYRISKAIRWLLPRIVRFIKWLRNLGKSASDIIERLGGLENILKLIAVFLGSALFYKGILAVQALEAAWKKAGAKALWAQAKMLLIPLAIAALVLALQDIYVFLEGGKSITGGLLKMAGVSEETIASMRENWTSFKDLLSASWGKDGILKTLEDFWRAVKDFHTMAIDNSIQQIKDWANAVKQTIKDIWGGLGKAVDVVLGNEGSTEGGRDAAFGFGGNKKPPPPSVQAGNRHFERISRDPRVSNNQAVKTQIQNDIKLNVNVKSDANPNKIAKVAKQVLGQAMNQAKRSNSTGVDY